MKQHRSITHLEAHRLIGWMLENKERIINLSGKQGSKLVNDELEIIISPSVYLRKRIEIGWPKIKERGEKKKPSGLEQRLAKCEQEIEILKKELGLV